MKPADSRDPCWRCGVPGAKGCAHQGPFEGPMIDRAKVDDRFGSLSVRGGAGAPRGAGKRFLVA